MPEAHNRSCPFCGGRDLLVDRPTLDAASVFCNGCGARGPVTTGDWSGEAGEADLIADAWSKWDTRRCDSLRHARPPLPELERKP